MKFRNGRHTLPFCQEQFRRISDHHHHHHRRNRRKMTPQPLGIEVLTIRVTGLMPSLSIEHYARSVRSRKSSPVRNVKTRIHLPETKRGQTHTQRRKKGKEWCASVGVVTKTGWPRLPGCVPRHVDEKKGQALTSQTTSSIRTTPTIMRLPTYLPA